MKTPALFVLFHLWVFSSFSQVIIWSEDFSSYFDGAVLGLNLNTSNLSIDWTASVCVSCGSNFDDWWEVRAGVFEAHDVNNEYCSITTESIDISSYSQVEISVDVTESGDLEGLYLGADNCTDQNNEDFVDIEYKLDGGPWTLVENYLGWCGLYASCASHTLYGDDNASGDCRTTDADWGTVTVLVGGISGDSIQLRLSTTNSSGDEYISFDNIIVRESTTLPVELGNFSVRLYDSYVDIDWSTVSENSNDFFIVERSTNLENWKVIQKVAGAGTTSEKQYYSITDELIGEGVYYYRLRQTDIDGKVIFYEAKSVDYKSMDIVKLYPNPAKSIISFSGLQTSKISSVRFFNSSGVLVRELEAPKELEFDISFLSANIYYVQIIATDETRHFKFMKMD